MLEANWLKRLIFIKLQLKLSIIFNILLSIGLLILMPVFINIKYLDPISSAIVLERIVSLTGILMLTPLFFPEQDKNIAEVVDSKFLSSSKVLMVRLLLSLIGLFLIVMAIVLIMHCNQCDFPAFKYLVYTYITATFLGSLGFAASGITNNIIVGYLLSATYYIINLSVGPKLGNFYLFSMSIGSYEEKNYLLGASIFLFFITFTINNIHRKKR